MLSVKASASLLSIAPSTLYGMVERREIAHYRIGGKILFEEADLELYKASCRVGVAPKATPPHGLRHVRLRHVSIGHGGTRDSGKGAGSALRASRDRSAQP